MARSRPLACRSLRHHARPHLFLLRGGCDHHNLKQWMQFWRSTATRHGPREDEKPIWQKDFFDRQLRSGESYRQKWLYIWENPIKAGLVKTPEEWPFQGELNPLPWHEASSS